jgi:fibronectin-binding autotransporter adhesin
VVPTAYIWSQTAPGTYDWTNAANWGGAGFPSAAGDTAAFPVAIVSAQSINMDVPTTIASITLTTGAGGALTIAPNGGSLTVGAITDSSTASNVDAINAPVTFTAAGAITNNSPGTLAVSGAMAIGGFALTLAGSGPITMGSISGAGGSVIMSGTNTDLFTGTDTYTAGTTITAGTFQVNSATAVPTTTTLTVSGGTLDMDGNNVQVTNVGPGSAAGTITDSSSATGTATFGISAQTAILTTLVKDGPHRKVGVAVANTNISAGTFTLTSANTFSGGLTLLNNATGTRLDITGPFTTTGTAGAITSSPFGTGPIIIGQTATDKAGIYMPAANTVLLNAIVFNTALGTDRVGIRADGIGDTLSGAITANLAAAAFSTNGTGAITLTGQVTGTQGLTLDNINGTTITVTLANAAGTNNYQGATNIAGTKGVLALGASNQIPDGASAGNVTDSGSLKLNGFSETINGLTGTGTVDGVSGTPTFSIDNNNATAMTFTGPIINTAGTLALVKLGTGSQILSGANTYGGGTSFTGTLQIGLAGTAGVLPAGTVVDNGTLIFNRTDVVTNASNISGTGTLTQAGTGTTILTGANTYAGITSVTAGTLEFAKEVSLYNDVTANWTAPNLVVASAATLSFGVGGTGDFVSTDLDILKGLGTAAGGYKTGSFLGIDTTDGAFSYGSAIANPNAGANVLGLVKLGLNSLTLTGNSTFTGGTTIKAGTLAIGINNALLPTGALIIGGNTTATGNLDLSLASQTLGSFVVSSNSATVDNITIGSGNTLQVNGAVTLGSNTSATDATNVTFTGLGTFATVGAATTFQVGGAPSTSSTTNDSATVDMSALANLNLSYLGGTIQIGDQSTTSPGNSNGTSTFILAQTNTITASNLGIGNNTGNGGTTQTLKLGSVANFLNVDTINIGLTTGQRSSGKLAFNTSTGTLQVRASNSTSGAVLNLVSTSSTTGTQVSGTVDVTGHQVNLLFSTWTMASRTGGSASGATATFSFDTGILNVTSLIEGNRTTGNTGTILPTINLNGGTASFSSISMGQNSTTTTSAIVSTAILNIGGTASVTVSGLLTMATLTNAATNLQNSTINITGNGVLNAQGGIVRAGTTSTPNTSISLAGGTLNLAAHAIGAAALPIGSGTGSLNFNSGTLSNITDINGGASLIKNTAGTLVLTGADTYPGTTTINAGILQVGDGTAIDAGSLGLGAVTDNGLLSFNRPDTITVANAISGGNDLQQLGAGTTVLTGANTYGGTTSIVAGILQIGAGGTAGALGAGPILDGSSLVLDRSDTVTIANAISGAGNFTQAGTGTVILTGANNLLGSTTISAGTLQVGNGGATSSAIGAGAVVDNGTLVFDQSPAYTVAGNISGTGGVTLAGSGTVTLAGTNTYSGATTVNAGTLIGDGDASTNVTVNSSGSMFGTGTYAAVTAGSFSNTSGTIDPATPTTTGVLAATSLTGNQGFTFQFEINGTTPGTSYDQIDVSGPVVLNNPTLSLSPALSGLNIGDTYTLIQGATSLTGTFRNQGEGSFILTGSGSSLQAFQISYIGGTGGHDVVLKDVMPPALLYVSSTWAGDTSGTTVTDPVLTDGNPAMIGGALNNAFSTIAGAVAAAQASPGDIIVVNTGNYATEDDTLSTLVSLQLQGGNVTVGSLSTTNPSIIVTINSGSSLTLGDSLSTTFGGAFSGPGNLTEVGSGNLTIIGTSQLTGGTTVSSGTLTLDLDGSGPGGLSALLGSSVVTVNSGSTLNLNLASTAAPYAFQGVQAIGGLAGAGTFNINYLNSTGALDTSFANLANNFLAGSTINLTQAAGGTSRLTGVSASGLASIGAAAVTVANGAQLSTGGAAGVFANSITLNGSGYSEAGGNLGALRIGQPEQWSGTITIGAGGARIGTLGVAATISGNITGPGAVTFGSGGTDSFLLTGPNDYAGVTTVSPGDTVIMGNNGTTGTLGASNTIVDNGTVAFNHSDDLTFSGTLSGTGSFVKQGSDIVTILSSTTYTGGTTIASGTLHLGNGTTVGTLGANWPQNNIADNGILILDHSDDLTYSGAISGTGSFVKLDSNILSLTGANTFSGGISLAAGSIVADLDGSGPSGASTLLGSGVVSVAASSTLSLHLLSVGAYTFSSALGGLSGAGSVNLFFDNTFGGIDSRFLALNNGGFSGTLTLTQAAGTGFSRIRDVSPTAGSSGTLGTANVVDNGAQILTDGTTGGSVFTNNFTLAGIGYADNGGFDGALRIGQSGQTFSGAISINGSAEIDALGPSGAAATGLISGSISGGALTIGSGFFPGKEVVVVSGSNSYTTTTIAPGAALLIGTGGTVGTGLVTVPLSASLQLQGNTLSVNSLAGLGSVSNSWPTPATLTLGADNSSSSFAGTLQDGAGGGSLSVNKVGSGTLTLSGAGSLSGTLTASAGTLDFGGGDSISTASLAAAGATYAFDFNGGSNGAVAVTGTVNLTGATLQLNSVASLPFIPAGATFTLVNNTGSSPVTSTFAGLPEGSIVPVNGTNLILSYVGGDGNNITLANPALAGHEFYVDPSYTAANFATGTVPDADPDTLGAQPATIGVNAFNTVGAAIAAAVAAQQTNSDAVSGYTVVIDAGTYAEAVSVPTGIGLILQSASLSSAVTFNSLADTTSSAVLYLAGTTLSIGSDNTSTSFASTIAGTGGIVKSGTGIFTLSGQNTFGGGFSLASGQLDLGSSTPLGTGTFTIAAGDIIDNTTGNLIGMNNPQVWNGSFTFLGSSPISWQTGAVSLPNATTLTLSGPGGLAIGGVISGAGSITRAGTGAGALTLGGFNTFTGGVTLSAGQINVNNASALGTGTFNIGAGTFDNTSGAAITDVRNNVQSWSGNFTFAGSNSLNLGTGAVTLTAARTITINGISLLTVNGPINGAFAITKNGPLPPDNLSLGGSNTFTGFTINQGGVTITNGNAFGTVAKTITDSNGTAGNPFLALDGSQGNITIPAAISFSTSNATNQGSVVNIAGNNTIAGNFSMTSGGGSTLLNVQAGSLNFSGTFSATTTSRQLVVFGPGTGTLSGALSNGTAAWPLLVGSQGPTGTAWTISGNANTYTGGTTVFSGASLFVTNTSGSATGTANVNVNSGAIFGGTGTITGTVADAGTVNPGFSGAAGVLTLGGLNFTTTGNLTIGLYGATNDEVVVTGTENLTNGTIVGEGPGSTMPIGSTITILHTTGGFGGTTFTNLPEGSGITLDGQAFTISYLANGGDDVTLTRIIPQAPTITSGTVATFLVGTPGTFNFTGTGSPAPTFTVTSGILPSGLTLTRAGVLSGNTNVGSGGVYVVTITASNGVGSPVAETFTITNNEAPTITSPAFVNFPVGVASSFTPIATGFPGATTISESLSDTLPPGVSFSGGVLSGTPTGPAGVFTLNFTATNAIGTSATQVFTLTVAQAPTFTSAAFTTFAVGSPGSFTVTAVGPPAPNISESGGDSLPSGVTFSGGVLSGTPTTFGVYSLNFDASNGISPDATQSFTLFVTPLSTVYVSSTFAGDAAGQFIADADFNTGGNQPAVFGTSAFADIADAVTAAAGTGTVVVDAGTYPESPSLPGSETLRLAGNVTVNSLDSAPGTTIDLQNNSLTTGDATGANTIAGDIVGSGQLIKTGSDSLVLTDFDSYSGGTTIAAGTLVVDGALQGSPASGPALTIASGATLAGIGSVAGAIASSGVVSPGDSVGATSTLSVGSITLGSGSLQIDLSSTAAYDVLAASGSVNLTGASLDLSAIDSNINDNDPFTIVTGSSVTGTFNGGSTVTVGSRQFSITYNPTSVVLTALPGTVPAPTLVSTVLNGGIAYINSTIASKQHSMVENVVYSFSQAISLTTANFTLTGIGGTTSAPNVALSSNSDGTVWTVTFTGAGVNNATHSIGDGEYGLVLSRAAGMAPSTYDFFRLLGDMDGNGTVDSSDFNILISSFLRGTADPAYLGADDLDGNNKVDGSDFNIFVSNFLKKLPNTTVLH